MKQRNEDENYRIFVEKMIQDNPQDTILMYTDAFFRIGKGLPGRSNVLLFPVKVIKGRKSFGRLQCLITPLLIGNDVGLSDTSLGQRWVDRKFLILSHDHEFKFYQKHIASDEE
jgi:hypothetical protein